MASKRKNDTPPPSPRKSQRHNLAQRQMQQPQRQMRQRQMQAQQAQQAQPRLDAESERKINLSTSSSVRGTGANNNSRKQAARYSPPPPPPPFAASLLPPAAGRRDAAAAGRMDAAAAAAGMDAEGPHDYEPIQIPLDLFFNCTDFSDFKEKVGAHIAATYNIEESSIDWNTTKIVTNRGRPITARDSRDSTSISFETFKKSLDEYSPISVFLHKKPKKKHSSRSGSKSASPEDMKALLTKVTANKKSPVTELNIQFKSRMSFYRLFLIQFACDPRHDYVNSKRLQGQDTGIKNAKKYFGLLLFGLVNTFIDIGKDAQEELRAFAMNLLDINFERGLKYDVIKDTKGLDILKHLITPNGNLEDRWLGYVMSSIQIQFEEAARAQPLRQSALSSAHVIAVFNNASFAPRKDSEQEVHVSSLGTLSDGLGGELSKNAENGPLFVGDFTANITASEGEEYKLSMTTDLQRNSNPTLIATVIERFASGSGSGSSGSSSGSGSGSGRRGSSSSSRRGSGSGSSGSCSSSGSGSSSGSSSGSGSSSSSGVSGRFELPLASYGPPQPSPNQSASASLTILEDVFSSDIVVAPVFVDETLTFEERATICYSTFLGLPRLKPLGDWLWKLLILIRFSMSNLIFPSLWIEDTKTRFVASSADVRVYETTDRMSAGMLIYMLTQCIFVEHVCSRFLICLYVGGLIKTLCVIRVGENEYNTKANVITFVKANQVKFTATKHGTATGLGTGGKNTRKKYKKIKKINKRLRRTLRGGVNTPPSSPPPIDSTTPPLRSPVIPVTQYSPAASSQSRESSQSAAAFSPTLGINLSSGVFSPESAAASSSSAAAFLSPSPAPPLAAAAAAAAAPPPPSASSSSAASSLQSEVEFVIPNDINIEMLFESITERAINNFDAVMGHHLNCQRFIYHIKNTEELVKVISNNTRDYTDATLGLDEMPDNLNGTFSSRDGKIMVENGKLFYERSKFVYLYNESGGAYFSLYVLHSLRF